MTLRNLTFVALLALGAGGLAAAAQADTASDYNLFVLGDMTSIGSDTEGRVAVGGNAYLQSYSVGAKASAGTTNLVVGGNLTANSGSTKGGTVVGGTATYSSWSKTGLAPSGTALPVDFASEAIRLKSLSTLLATYVPTSNVGYQNWGAPAGSHSYQITMNAVNAGVNVFTLDATKAADANTFTINLSPGATVLINVTGTTDILGSGGITINGGTGANVLWNFADATSLSFRSINMEGSVLAPLAAYSGGAPVAGQMIVGSFTGPTWNVSQINSSPYGGPLLSINPIPPAVPHDGDDSSSEPAVPEPTSWATMLIGFAMLGAVMRRRKAGTTFA
jgi:choice-of-anchor A domain-containing protein